MKKKIKKFKFLLKEGLERDFPEGHGGTGEGEMALRRRRAGSGGTETKTVSLGNSTSLGHLFPKPEPC